MRASPTFRHRPSGRKKAHALGRASAITRRVISCRSMAVGDQAVFLCPPTPKPPGIIGLMEVIETGINRPSQVEHSVSYFRSVAHSLKRLAGIAFAAPYLRRFKYLLKADALRENFSTEENSTCCGEETALDPAGAAATAHGFRPAGIGN